MKPTHLLVLRFSALGDVAMTVPILMALSQQQPDLKITVVSRAFFKPIFAQIPNVEFFAADLKGKHKGILGLYRLSKELRRLSIDGVADLHNVLRTKILRIFFSLGGLRVQQVDKGRTEKKALVKGVIFEPLKTTHERYADVFRSFNLNIDLSRVKLLRNKLNSQDEQEKHKKPHIGIAPFAAFSGKMYPLNLMEQVIAALCKKGYAISLFGGGSEEKAKLEAIAASFEGVTSMVGKQSFEQELNQIAALDAMIAMDSGNAHLAAMFGVPTITIWGVTHPYAGFYPFGQPMENAVLPDREQFPKIPTSVYGNKMPVGYEKAMETILPDQIVAKVMKLVAAEK